MHFNRISYLLFFLMLLLIGNGSEAQRYSVDAEPQKKLKLKVSPKKMFRKNPEKKAVRKEEKKKKRSAKYEKKAIKKYWKTYDHPKEVKTDQRVYKRMKKNLKRSDRINQGQHPDPLVKRMFHPKRETKRVKENRQDNRKKNKFRLWKKKA